MSIDFIQMMKENQKLASDKEKQNGEEISKQLNKTPDGLEIKEKQQIKMMPKKNQCLSLEKTIDIRSVFILRDIQLISVNMVSKMANHTLQSKYVTSCCSTDIMNLQAI